MQSKNSPATVTASTTGKNHGLSANRAIAVRQPPAGRESLVAGSAAMLEHDGTLRCGLEPIPHARKGNCNGFQPLLAIGRENMRIR
jgi:hypothetical protein